MKNSFRIVAVVIFLAGVVLLSIASAKHERAQKLQSFVATYVTTLETQDARNGQSELAVRAVTGDGRWREVRWRNEGKVVQLADKENVYEVEGGEVGLQYVGPNSDEIFSNERLSRATRTEMVAGIKAYVFRNENPDGYIEYYFAPEMGSHHIKAVIYKAASHYKYIREAVAVQFRPVSDEEVAVPKLPVKFDNIDKEIDAMKKSGTVDTDFEETVQKAKNRAKAQ